MGGRGERRRGSARLGPAAAAEVGVLLRRGAGVLCLRVQEELHHQPLRALWWSAKPCACTWKGSRSAVLTVQPKTRTVVAWAGKQGAGMPPAFLGR